MRNLRGNVFRAFAQGREANQKHTESVKQVRPKTASDDFLLTNPQQRFSQSSTLLVPTPLSTPYLCRVTKK